MKRLPLVLFLFLPFAIFTGCNCDVDLPPIEPAWGIADLHAHPASHLGFGANESGEDGILWGSPGLRWEDAASTLSRDLAQCSVDKHSGFDIDPVRHITRGKVMDVLNELTGYTHTSHGYSSDSTKSFSNWPAAQSVIHQQMHVEFLRRAWEGGVRLMVASVTDNQTLAMLWNSSLGISNEVPPPDSSRELESARRQLDFIHKLVEANSSWLAIATNPTLARAAIAQNKMVLILGVEMDTLTSEELIRLKRSHQVSSVIPIHLVDNAFGGSAVYSDVFNANNNYINKQFFDVVADSNLDFRLGIPQRLERIAFIALEPGGIDRIEYCGLNYEPCPEIPGHQGIPFNFGHKNKRGLNKWELRRLMKSGLLVDVAHMSEAATDEALSLAEKYGYPVMNSHTGVRLAGARAASERSMLSTHVERMAALGGVLGLGTEGNLREKTLFSAGGAPLVQLTGKTESHTFDLSRPVVTMLKLTVRTGSDSLTSEEKGTAVVRLADAEPVVVELNPGTGFGSGSVNSIDIPLPEPVFRQQLQAFQLVVSMDRMTAVPYWSIDEVKLEAVLQSGSRVTLIHESGTPLVLLGSGTGYLRALQNGFPPETSLRKLHLKVRTGGDDLRGGNDNAFVELMIRDRGRFRYDLNRGKRLADATTTDVTLDLPDGVRMQDLASVRLLTILDGDDWEVDGIRLEAEDRSGNRATLVHRSGSPIIKFNDKRSEMTVFVGDPAPLSPDAPARLLRVTVRTGDDDLREGSIATGTVILADGRSHTFPLNQGANWKDYMTYHRLVRLPFSPRVKDLRSLRIDADLGSDDWKIAEVHVQVLGDPVEQWLNEYQEVSALMGGRPVALGTDINGFAPQIPLSLASLPDPITVAVDHSADAPEAVRNALRPLGKSTVGGRIFDFAADGIAHYGMIPDFVQAVALQPSGAESVAKLFQSAEAVLQMWDRALQARKRVIEEEDTVARRLRITVDTGRDNLRGGDDNAWAFFQLNGTIPIQFGLNEGNEWGSHTTHEVQLTLPSPQPIRALTSFGVRTNFKGGTFGENWDMAGIKVEFQREDGGWEVLLERRGSPFRRFTGDYREWSMPL